MKPRDTTQPTFNAGRYHSAVSESTDDLVGDDLVFENVTQVTPQWLMLKAAELIADAAEHIGPGVRSRHLKEIADRLKVLAQR